MGKIKRLVGAYLFASGAAVVPGAIGAELLRAWGLWPGLDTLQAAGAFWLMVIGTPTVAAGWTNLWRELGNKAPVVVQAGGIRRIPVNNPLSRLTSWLSPAPAYALGDQAAAVGVWGARTQPQRATLDVGAGITLSRVLPGGEEIVADEALVARLVNGAWARQRAGEAHPFSRKYWVQSRPPKIEREYYDIILDVLQHHHLVIGRRQGAGGRLICEPRHVLTELRHYYHSPAQPGAPFSPEPQLARFGKLENFNTSTRSWIGFKLRSAPPHGGILPRRRIGQIILASWIIAVAMVVLYTMWLFS